MIFEDLIKKYNLEPNQKLPLVGTESYSKHLNHILEKWGFRFARGYWNVDLGLLPKVWFLAIDEMLDIIEKDSPDFKIMQIKLKFGGIRIYLLNISDAVFDGVEKMEQVLYDEALIY